MVTGLQLASLGIDSSAYEDLSEEEIKALESILTDISNGNTDQYNELYDTDYKEIPVDYSTFLVDDQFLGKSTKHGTRIYDFWKQEGQKIFNTQDAVEVALSGAIGTGKTTNGCAMMAYHMYTTMCMRDPQDFFGLRTGSKIAYVFLNNTLDSSAGVGYDTFQSFLMHSPWFLKHGNVVGRTDETRHYVPDGGFEILIGSRVQHTLGHNCIACLMDEVSFSTGQDVNYTKCLVGETIIKTSTGEFQIKDLEGAVFRVYSYSPEGEIILSDDCTVIETMKTSKLIDIELEDGTHIKCTPYHRLMLKNGEYKMAKDLTDEDELMEW